MIIGERSYVLRSSMIETVLGVSSMKAEQNEHEGITGTITTSGRVFRLIDLRKELFGKETRFYLNTRILIPSPRETNNAQCGFIVEKVLDLVRVVQSQSLHHPMLIDGVSCYSLSLASLTSKYQGANCD
jgi:chemotaxis signal transduction protein